MPCYASQGIVRVVNPSSYAYPLASLIGDVIVRPGCFIAPGASLRGDFGQIIVEGDHSIRDSVKIHAAADRDTVIGRSATIGHGAVTHGAMIGETDLISMNTVVLDHAQIGAGSLVPARALAKSDTITSPRSLVAGNPATVVRTLAHHQVSWRDDGGGEYHRLAREALMDFVETLSPSKVESDRRRLRPEADGVQLSGPTAALREQRAQEFEDMKGQN